MKTESTKFDLEWAKRGGCVILRKKFEDDSEVCCKLFNPHGDWGSFISIRPNGESSEVISCGYSSTDDSLDCDEYEVVRMATRDECTAAGAEYIERPVSAEELESLREDKVMLDFIISQDNFVMFNEAYDIDEEHTEIDGTEHFEMIAARYIGDGEEISRGATPREAIRAAMKVGE